MGRYNAFFNWISVDLIHLVFLQLYVFSINVYTFVPLESICDSRTVYAGQRQNKLHCVCSWQNSPFSHGLPFKFQNKAWLGVCSRDVA